MLLACGENSAAAEDDIVAVDYDSLTGGDGALRCIERKL